MHVVLEWGNIAIRRLNNLEEEVGKLLEVENEKKIQSERNEEGERGEKGKYVGTKGTNSQQQTTEIIHCFAFQQVTCPSDRALAPLRETVLSNICTVYVQMPYQHIAVLSIQYPYYDL
jgi:hypothetical protein